jgi:hypothetical protein
MKTLACLLVVSALSSCFQPVRHLDDLGEKSEFEKLTEARAQARNSNSPNPP